MLKFLKYISVCVSTEERAIALRLFLSVCVCVCVFWGTNINLRFRVPGGKVMDLIYESFTSILGAFVTYRDKVRANTKPTNERFAEKFYFHKIGLWRGLALTHSNSPQNFHCAVPTPQRAKFSVNLSPSNHRVVFYAKYVHLFCHTAFIPFFCPHLPL